MLYINKSTMDNRIKNVEDKICKILKILRNHKTICNLINGFNL